MHDRQYNDTDEITCVEPDEESQNNALSEQTQTETQSVSKKEMIAIVLCGILVPIVLFVLFPTLSMMNNEIDTDRINERRNR